MDNIIYNDFSVLWVGYIFANYRNSYPSQQYILDNMYKIPSILTADEIIDKAFKKAKKVQVVVKGKSKKDNKIAIAKVKAVKNTISSSLNRYVKSFPSFDTIPPFYYELFDASIGVDALRKSLGALDWCRKTIENIADETVAKIRRSDNREYIKAQRTCFFGRSSSVIKQISKDLDFLNRARRKLLSVPEIYPEKPTIVIAGAPNVGKSLLVTQISSAKPKIASYPFTTKGISVGHFESEGIIYQVIDTPGLLDREMEKRNEMEQKAILALRHLANIIVFVIDPSEYCGYTMDSQLRILSDIKTRFREISVIEVENKVDIVKLDTSRFKISALRGDGVMELKDIVVSNLKGM
ncbi:MAG: 50S ribosome-binding GTPase [Thermoplasmata archaeon]|nr:MAG: 50S ribosome-binding GTPase [Thermoplasmata archaeon]